MPDRHLAQHVEHRLLPDGEVEGHPFEAHLGVRQIERLAQCGREITETLGRREVGGAAAEVDGVYAARARLRKCQGGVADLPRHLAHHLARGRVRILLVREGAEAAAAHGGIAEGVGKHAHDERSCRIEVETALRWPRARRAERAEQGGHGVAVEQAMPLGAAHPLPQLGAERVVVGLVLALGRSNQNHRLTQ